DVELASQVISDPEIVISADVCNGEPRAAQLAEPLQHGHVALRHRVAVLEPEIEEVADDVERGSLREDKVEQAQEIALPPPIGIGGSLAQVGVRDEIGASGLGHDASV